jgi:oligopeptidase B
MSISPAPQAPKKPQKDTYHGISRQDDYAWLRADNWQDVMRDPDTLAPEIRDYLEAENAYIKGWMQDTRTLQSHIFKEMKGRIKEDDSSVPARDGAYEYYTRFITGGQHPLFCRCKTGGKDEQILIDGNALAKDEAYFNIGNVAHSPDHTRIAYAFDDKGSEYYTIRILDIKSGARVADDICDTNGDPVWGRSSSDLYYTRLDANHRPSQIFLCTLNQNGDDRLVYEEADAGFFAGIGMLQSRKFLAIDAHDHQTSEIRLIDLENPDAGPSVVAPRQTGHEYDVEHHGEHLYIRSNLEAEDFRIVRAPLGNPGVEHWEDVVPHKPGRLILWHNCTARHLVRLEREDGLPRLVIREFASGDEHEIAFDEEAYSLGAQGGFEFDTDSLRFTYSSMTTPSQVFDYDMTTRRRVLRKTQEVPSGHEPSDYVTRRVFAPAKDGELVPVSLLYAKDTVLDGSAPLLLYGYGAYGISMPAAFSTNILSLVDRGFVYAIAHIRGGMEKGYRWYACGRREHKMNTFTDFIAAGEYLARENFTAKGRIVAHGGSAGGMLMGATANMAPELFGAIIAEVPFVDVLTTMLDDSLPLTPPEWPEWGNPIADKAAYETIAAYSPYDNVAARDYPPILALAGLTDPRVTYWEPAKWVAKLRALKTDDNVLLLKTNMEAGHAGASGRFDSLKERALSTAFALKIMGKMDA